MAENAAESLRKGQRVIVAGRLKNRPYEDKDGNKRTSLEMTADEIGPSLRWAVAAIDKVTKSKPAGSAGTPYAPDEEPF
jgi:single-strand DNA-binding protein